MRRQDRDGSDGADAGGQARQHDLGRRSRRPMSSRPSPATSTTTTCRACATISQLHPELTQGSTSLAILLRRFLVESAAPNSFFKFDRNLSDSLNGQQPSAGSAGPPSAGILSVAPRRAASRRCGTGTAAAPRSGRLPHRRVRASAPAGSGRRVALLVDARFPGGTGGAVAAEIRALAPHAGPRRSYGLETAMFRGRPPQPGDRRPRWRRSACRCCPSRRWSTPTPSCCTTRRACKFDRRLAAAAERRRAPSSSRTRTSCGPAAPRGSTSATASTSSPSASPAASGCSRRSRRATGATVAAWLAQRPGTGWRLAADDWPNICDQPFLAPTAAPRDRRGRHSRPGFEKFPPLGGAARPVPAARRALRDPRRRHPAARPRTACRRTGSCCRFGAMRVADFLASIDFFVYFTHPLLRESYRPGDRRGDRRRQARHHRSGHRRDVRARAWSPTTASGVDRIVAAHIADPGRYAAAVRRAQADLARHRPEPVAARLLALIESEVAVDAFL